MSSDNASTHPIGEGVLDADVSPETMAILHNRKSPSRTLVGYHGV